MLVKRSCITNSINVSWFVTNDTKIQISLMVTTCSTLILFVMSLGVMLMACYPPHGCGIERQKNLMNECEFISPNPPNRATLIVKC